MANLTKGEWGYAALRGVGLVPFAGDIAKVAGALGEFIEKHIDDALMIVSAINKIGEQFPDIIKHLPTSSLDDIADALKDGKQLSKAEYSKLKKAYEAAGKNLDDMIEIPFKYSDEISSGISKIAKKYNSLLKKGDFKCDICANEIMKQLKSIGQNGTKLELTYGNEFIIHDLYSVKEAVSKNGKHYAILYNNLVYDNIFPNGIGYDDWLNGFAARYGEKIIKKINF